MADNNNNNHSTSDNPQQVVAHSKRSSSNGQITTEDQVKADIERDQNGDKLQIKAQVADHGGRHSRRRSVAEKNESLSLGESPPVLRRANLQQYQQHSQSSRRQSQHQSRQPWTYQLETDAGWTPALMQPVMPSAVQPTIVQQSRGTTYFSQPPRYPYQTESNATASLNPELDYSPPRHQPPLLPHPTAAYHTGNNLYRTGGALYRTHSIPYDGRNALRPTAFDHDQSIQTDNNAHHAILGYGPVYGGGVFPATGPLLPGLGPPVWTDPTQTTDPLPTVSAQFRPAEQSGTFDPLTAAAYRHCFVQPQSAMYSSNHYNGLPSQILPRQQPLLRPLSHGGHQRHHQPIYNAQSFPTGTTAAMLDCRQMSFTGSDVPSRMYDNPTDPATYTSTDPFMLRPLGSATLTGAHSAGGWPQRQSAQPIDSPPIGNRQIGNRPIGNRPLGNRPFGERPWGDRSFEGRSFESLPFGGRQSSNMPPFGLYWGDSSAPASNTVVRPPAWPSSPAGGLPPLASSLAPPLAPLVPSSVAAALRPIPVTASSAEESWRIRNPYVINMTVAHWRRAVVCDIKHRTERNQLMEYIHFWALPYSDQSKEAIEFRRLNPFLYLFSHPLVSLIIPPPTLRYIPPKLTDNALFSMRVRVVPSRRSRTGVGLSPLEDENTGLPPPPVELMPRKPFELAASADCPGFENIMSNDWSIAIWGFFYYGIPQVRLSVAKHDCREPLCWICELAVAFRNLDISREERRGQPIQVRNLTDALLRFGPITNFLKQSDPLYAALITSQIDSSENLLAKLDNSGLNRTSLLGLFSRRVRARYFPRVKRFVTAAPPSSSPSSSSSTSGDGSSPRHGGGTSAEADLFRRRRRLLRNKLSQRRSSGGKLDLSAELLKLKPRSAESLIRRAERRRERARIAMRIREYEQIQNREQTFQRAYLHMKLHHTFNYLVSTLSKCPRIDCSGYPPACRTNMLMMSPADFFSFFTQVHVECPRLYSQDPPVQNSGPASTPVIPSDCNYETRPLIASSWSSTPVSSSVTHQGDVDSQSSFSNTPLGGSPTGGKTRSVADVEQTWTAPVESVLFRSPASPCRQSALPSAIGVTTKRIETYFLDFDHSLWMNRRLESVRPFGSNQQTFDRAFHLPVSSGSSYMGTLSSSSSCERDRVETTAGAAVDGDNDDLANLPSSEINSTASVSQTSVSSSPSGEKPTNSTISKDDQNFHSPFSPKSMASPTTGHKPTEFSPPINPNNNHGPISTDEENGEEPKNVQTTNSSAVPQFSGTASVSPETTAYPSFPDMLRDSLWQTRHVTMTCQSCLGSPATPHTLCNQTFSLPPVISLKVKLYGVEHTVTEQTSAQLRPNTTTSVTPPVPGIITPDSVLPSRVNLGEKVKPLDFWRTFRRPFAVEMAGDIATSPDSVPLKGLVDSLEQSKEAFRADELLGNLVRRWLRLRAEVEGSPGGSSRDSLVAEFRSLSKILKNSSHTRNSPLPAKLYIGRPYTMNQSLEDFSHSSANPWRVYETKRATSPDVRVCGCLNLNCARVHEYTLICLICSINHTWTREMRRTLWEIWTSDVAPRLGVRPSKRARRRNGSATIAGTAPRKGHLTRRGRGRPDLLRIKFKQDAPALEQCQFSDINADYKLSQSIEAEEALVEAPCTEDQMVSYVRVAETFVPPSDRRRTALTASKPPPERQPGRWLLINGPVTSFVEEHEVRWLSVPWKFPCAIFYARTNVLWHRWFLRALPPPPPPFPSTDDLLNLKSLSQRPLQQPTFMQLSKYERLKLERGDLSCSLDGEHVVVSKLSKQPINIFGDHELTALGRITAIRADYDEFDTVPFLDHYLYFKEEPIDYRTTYSGLSPGDLDLYASHVLATQKQICQLLRFMIERGCKFIGHDLFNDFRVIGLIVPSRLLIDTVELYRLPSSQRLISLRYLTFTQFNRKIQEDSHDSIEDAFAALMLYRKYLYFVYMRSNKEWRWGELSRLYQSGYPQDFKIEPNTAAMTTALSPHATQPQNNYIAS